MPNHRGTPLTSDDLETAHPWAPDRFARPEPQEQRGEPGSRDIGELARRRDPELDPATWSGVNPMPPLRPDMPRLKPGDQGG